MRALPQLLYIGDVPIEASYHGSLLLYRLLQNYNPRAVKVVETGLQASSLQRRLPEVSYNHLPPRLGQLLNTRLHRWASSALIFLESRRFKALRGRLADFNAEAILTIAHGYGWTTAAQYAQELNLPLHLIVHDDLKQMAPVLPVFASVLENRCRSVYRQAVSRLCISPEMVEDYRESYGEAGTLLYPSRGRDGIAFDKPANRTLESNRSLTVAFAGTINSGGYRRLLANLAECLQLQNGTLVIFGPQTRASLHTAGLRHENIRYGGLIRSNDLLQQMRSEADVLFAPMSFEEIGHKENMRLAFPSKLADYTAVGLPLLICGPEYCSAVRWARENHPVAEIVTSESPKELASALMRLQRSAHRWHLASRALEIGNKFFKHEVAEQVFFDALRRTEMRAIVLNAA